MRGELAHVKRLLRRVEKLLEYTPVSEADAEAYAYVLSREYSRLLDLANKLYSYIEEKLAQYGLAPEDLGIQPYTQQEQVPTQSVLPQGLSMPAAPGQLQPLAVESGLQPPQVATAAGGGELPYTPRGLTLKPVTPLIIGRPKRRTVIRSRGEVLSV